jgi:choline dehydrogenase-like flavoprotein
MAEKIYDVLIVGTGAAGGMMAQVLAEQGLSILILEAGARLNPRQDYKNDELYMANLFNWPWPITVKGEFPIIPATNYGVGGTTQHYGGYSVRFHESDFQAKSRDGVADDWPITFKDLEPYYQKAEKIIGVAGENKNPFEPPRGPYPMPPHRWHYWASKYLQKGCDQLGIKLLKPPLAITSEVYDKRPPCNYCGFCQQGCMISAKYSSIAVSIPKAEAKGAKLVTRAFVTRILTTKDKKRVEGVIYIDRTTGKEKRAKAKVVIIAANGIQTPRLLLLSDGLANSSGMVGKNYMVHVQQMVWGIFDEPIRAYRGMSVAGMIQDFYETNPKNPFVRGYLLTGATFGPAGVAVVSELWGKKLKDFMRQYAHMACLATFGDDLPYEGNTVTLDPQIKDEFGLPVPRVTHKFLENDLAIKEAAYKKSQEILEASGAKSTFRDEGGQHFGLHTMGTCRMGKDPKNSVTNSFGQTHDIKNLFLAGSSIFVTASPAPPTLTIQALALRAAEYIVDQSKKGNL